MPHSTTKNSTSPPKKEQRREIREAQRPVTQYTKISGSTTLSGNKIMLFHIFSLATLANSILLHYLCDKKPINNERRTIMKRIFTLLFCVVAVSFAASADSYADRVEQCINALLGKITPTTLMINNLDANHDGALNIDDVTTIIDEGLQEQQTRRAPAKDNEIKEMINNMLNNEPPTPTIDDVTDAVDKKLKKD